MKLIPAKVEDIPWIMMLEKAPENRNFVWQGSYEEHLFEINDPDSYLLIHLDKSDKNIGYSLNKFHKKSKNFEIRRIVVNNKGLGLGKKSMKALLDFGFNELGAQRIWLDVYPENEIGISLYKSLGFTQEAHLRRSDYQRGKYYDQLVFGLLKEEYQELLL
ncbi:MAG TPA: GNAT family N-acetyltransferase [Clostridia bacterium]|nr:GNAT family N-acetyltransferase [Clostridia bacterium]